MNAPNAIRHHIHCENVKGGRRKEGRKEEGGSSDGQMAKRRDIFCPLRLARSRPSAARPFKSVSCNTHFYANSKHHAPLNVHLRHPVVVILKYVTGVIQLARGKLPWAARIAYFHSYSICDCEESKISFLLLRNTQSKAPNVVYFRLSCGGREGDPLLYVGAEE